MEKYNKLMKGLVETLHEASLNESYVAPLGEDYHKFEDLLKKYKIYVAAQIDGTGDPIEVYLTNPKNKHIGFALITVQDGFFFYDEGGKVHLGNGDFMSIRKAGFESNNKRYGRKKLYAYNETNAKILKDILTK